MSGLTFEANTPIKSLLMVVAILWSGLMFTGGAFVNNIFAQAALREHKDAGHPLTEQVINSNKIIDDQRYETLNSQLESMRSELRFINEKLDSIRQRQESE